MRTYYSPTRAAFTLENNAMKRFLVFAFDRFYPEGGAKDFVASFDTESEAWEACAHSDKDCAHIYDSELSRITYERIRN